MATGPAVASRRLALPMTAVYATGQATRLPRLVGRGAGPGVGLRERVAAAGRRGRPRMNQATFFATITDTTPGIVTDLLTRLARTPPAP